MARYVIFDIDLTVAVSPTQSQFVDASHQLTEMWPAYPDGNHYKMLVINKDWLSNLITQILDEGINIIFMTAGAYDSGFVTALSATLDLVEEHRIELARSPIFSRDNMAHYYEGNSARTALTPKIDRLCALIKDDGTPYTEEDEFHIIDDKFTEVSQQREDMNVSYTHATTREPLDEENNFYHEAADAISTNDDDVFAEPLHGSAFTDEADLDSIGDTISTAPLTGRLTPEGPGDDLGAFETDAKDYCLHTNDIFNSTYDTWKDPSATEIPTDYKDDDEIQRKIRDVPDNWLPGETTMPWQHLVTTADGNAFADIHSAAAPEY